RSNQLNYVPTVPRKPAQPIQVHGRTCQSGRGNPRRIHHAPRRAATPRGTSGAAVAAVSIAKPTATVVRRDRRAPSPARATASGSAARPITTALGKPARRANSVVVKPGQSVRTMTGVARSSAASASPNEITNAFDAAYTASYGTGNNPAVDATS